MLVARTMLPLRSSGTVRPLDVGDFAHVTFGVPHEAFGPHVIDGGHQEEEFHFRIILKSTCKEKLFL